MAIGLTIGDGFGNSFTLGSLPAHTASSQVANQHYAQTVLRTRGTSNRPYDYLRLCEVRQQVPQRDPYTGVRTCGLPGAPPCMTGGAQTAFSGLGGLDILVPNIACSEHDNVLHQLEILLSEAKNRNATSTVEYGQAQTYFKSMTGFAFNRPVLPGTCRVEVAKAKSLYEGLRTSLGTGVPIEQAVPPTSNIATAVKWGAVAVAVVAGAYALGPLIRGLGSMVGKKK